MKHWRKGGTVPGYNETNAAAVFTPLRRIPGPTGDVLHGMKASSAGYNGFGEAYFSTVLEKAVKGWKKHTRMTLNLIVVKGEIRIMTHDAASGHFQAFHMTPERTENYGRLTVPPGLWVAFAGVAAGENMLLNIADLEHDPAEAETLPLDAFAWTWS